MKNSARTIATSSIENRLNENLGNATLIRRNKKNFWAVETGVKDENGTPIYALVSYTIGATEDTKTAKAFDLEEGIKEYTEWLNAPKKEKKPAKELSPEEQERRELRNAQKQALYAWVENNLGSAMMSTTDIQLACEDVRTVPLMMVGTWMTNYAKDSTTIVREHVKGKTYYRKA